MSENLFEFATRNKICFSTPRGPITVEQLWDVPLRSTRDDFNLDTIAKAAHKAFQAAAEESFVVEATQTAQHKRLEAAFEIVKHVIATKLAEEAAAKQRAEKRNEKAQLLQILAEKQAGALSALSEEELKKKIAALEA